MNRLFAPTACAFFMGAALAGCSTFSLDAESLTGPSAKHEADRDKSGKAPAIDLDSEVRQAQLLRTQGDLAGATHALSQLMLVAPDDPRVVGEYGKVLVQQGRSGEALDFLKRAVELNPADWTLYSAMGVAFDQQNDQASAKLAYEHALALKPGEAAVLNNYAMSRMLAGDLPGARQLIAQAASTGSADPKIARNLALVENLAPARDTAPMAMASASAPAAKPVRTRMANMAPKPLASSAAGMANNTQSRVVMQDVPFDPLAGPVAKHVAHATRHPRKLAIAAAPKLRKERETAAVAPAAKPKAKPVMSPPPALRKMADADKP